MPREGKPLCYVCPSCNMLVWQDSHIKQAVCPFCCGRLPSFVTKIYPERMSMRENTEPGDSQERGIHGPAGEARGEASPFILEFFMVQSAGYRCMAYLNKEGKWRGAFDHRELPGTIRVLE